MSQRPTIRSNEAHGQDGAQGSDDHELYFRTRDQAARRRLLERYEPLATKVASRYSRSRRDRDDLRQVALLGILRALDRFDPSRGVKFTTFAWATAAGEIKRYRRDNDWSMHLPRTLQERYLHVAATVDELPTELGREPTVGDVAERVGETETAVRECLDIRAHYPMSLDHCFAGDPDSAWPLGADETRWVDDRDALAWGLSRLRSSDREVVVLHYLQGMTQGEIAEELGGSQMKVSRALTRGLDHLRALLAPLPRRELVTHHRA